MDTYHKIITVYLRDPDNKYRTLFDGKFAIPEFEYLADNEWIFTEKIDGTNMRFDWDCEKVSIGGRTDKAQIPVFLYDQINELFPIEKFKALYPGTPMTLYGEGYGAKIQKGGGNYISDDVSFIVFDIMINCNFLSRENVEDITEHLGIDVVPIIDKGTLHKAVSTVRQGFASEVGTQKYAEGLVMRPVIELRDRIGQRIISKIYD